MPSMPAEAFKGQPELYVLLHFTVHGEYGDFFLFLIIDTGSCHRFLLTVMAGCTFGKRAAPSGKSPCRNGRHPGRGKSGLTDRFAARIGCYHVALVNKKRLAGDFYPIRVIEESTQQAAVYHRIQLAEIGEAKSWLTLPAPRLYP